MFAATVVLGTWGEVALALWAPPFCLAQQRPALGSMALPPPPLCLRLHVDVFVDPPRLFIANRVQRAVWSSIAGSGVIDAFIDGPTSAARVRVGWRTA
jgi:hypothetical protein